MRLAAVLSPCVACLVACQGPARPRSAVPERATAACYALTYEGTHPGLAPDRVALHPGGDGGRAVWLPSPGQVYGEYVLVGQEGRWRTNADSLVIEFHTPRTLTDIVLHGAGDTLWGRAGAMSDGAIGIWGWQPAIARRFACTDTHSFPSPPAR